MIFVAAERHGDLGTYAIYQDCFGGSREGGKSLRGRRIKGEESLSRGRREGSRDCRLDGDSRDNSESRCVVNEAWRIS